jgi:magnesium-protoporphyrin IX monomethyl ester (oxidative) cyclase
MARMAQPPLGLSYVGSVLAQAGHQVRIYDAQFFRNLPNDLKKVMEQDQPDYVGLTSTTPQWNQALTIARLIKEINPRTRIVVGGCHVSTLPRESIESPYIDFVVQGEGEHTMVELVDGDPPDQIKGLVYRHNGTIQTNPVRPLIEDLDSIPFPMIKTLPVHRYCYPHMGNCIVVLSSRGCPHHCAFCASGVVNEWRVRKRSVTNFVEEIAYLYHDSRIKNFRFADETFCLDSNRVISICDSICNRGLKIKWSCTTTVLSLNPNVLRGMRKAGCRLIEIGIESANREVRRSSQKIIDLESVRKVIAWAHQQGIRVSGDFILGLPGESEQTILETIEFARSSRLDYAQFAMLVPLPGTRIWDMINNGNTLRCLAKSWEDYSRYGQAIVESNSLDRHQLTLLHRLAIRKFYLNPRRLLKLLRNAWRPADLANLFKSGLAFFEFLRNQDTHR